MRYNPVGNHGLTDKEVAVLDRMSNVNLLRSINGEIYNANGAQRRTLKRAGIIRLVGCNRRCVQLVFTERGKELLEEM